MALAAGALGYRVVAHARTSDAAEGASQRIEAAGGRAIAVSGDIRDPELGQRLIAASSSAFGEVPRVMIFNAGVLGPVMPLGEMSQEDFDRVLSVNVNAQFMLTRALVNPMLAAGGGALVYLTSGLGRFALPGYGAYTVSKHAVEGLAKQIDATMRQLQEMQEQYDEMCK